MANNYTALTPGQFGTTSIKSTVKPVTSTPVSTPTSKPNISLTPEQQSAYDTSVKKYGYADPNKTVGSVATAPSLGIKAQSPVMTPPINTLPQNQVSTSGTPTTSSSTDNGTSGTPSPYTVNNGLYGQLVTGIANQSQNQNPAIAGAIGGLLNTAKTNSGTSGPAYTEYQQAIQDLAEYKQKLAETNKGISAEGISLNSSRGQIANIGQAASSVLDALQQKVNEKAAAIGYQQTGVGQQQAGYNSAGSLGTSSQNLAQGALGSAAGFSQPQLGQYGQGYYNPTQPGQNAASGGFGTGPSAAANAETVKNNTTQINNINGVLPAADAAFSVLGSYAQKIGGGNTPIFQGLQQLYGSTAQGSQAVAGFKAQLQAVRQAWAAIEGGDPNTAIPDNITAGQLTQIQQQLKTDSQNKIAALTNQNNQFQGSGGGSGGGVDDWNSYLSQ